MQKITPEVIDEIIEQKLKDIQKLIEIKHQLIEERKNKNEKSI